MAYRFQRKESVAQGIRRVSLEQTVKAAQQLGEDVDLAEGIHNARKSFKKSRSLLRLVRRGLGEELYQAQNQWLREAKNRLSSARDAEAMVETFDKLADRYQAVGECPVFATVRESLVDRRNDVAGESPEVVHTARETAESLRSLAHGIEDWALSGDDFEVLAPGFQRTYRRGRKAMRKAYRHPSDENFHEWRKRVKDHWYHCRLLRNTWPATMKPRIANLTRLSDALGDDHDLGILCHALHATAQGLDGDVDTLSCLAQSRQDELRQEARTLGARLYAEKPKRLAATLGAYWRAWKG